MVRIDSTETPWYASDAAMAARAGCPVMLPKVASGVQMRQLVESLGSGARVVPLVYAVPGVVRVAFGSVDLGAELGVDPDAALTVPWRAASSCSPPRAGRPGTARGRRYH